MKNPNFKLLNFSLLFSSFFLITSCSDDDDFMEGMDDDMPAMATCSDGVMNGDERGVDCGGTACEPCEGEAGRRAELYVTNNENGNISKYSATGDSLITFTGMIAQSDQTRVAGVATLLGNPIDIAYDHKTNTVFITEVGNGKVLAF